MNALAAASVWPEPFSTSDGTAVPYASVLESLSTFSAPPDRLIPANSPLLREYDSTVARLPVVLADAARPTGPAATDASAPSDTLLFSIVLAASRFVTRSTRSISVAPAWNPQLPFSSSMNTGELQPLAVRQLITPLPYSPPTMNAAFFMSGMTMTQEAFCQRSSGTPFSAPRSAVTTDAASLSRFCSAVESAANAVVATSDERTNA